MLTYSIRSILFFTKCYLLKPVIYYFWLDFISWLIQVKSLWFLCLFFKTGAKTAGILQFFGVCFCGKQFFKNWRSRTSINGRRYFINWLFLLVDSYRFCTTVLLKCCLQFFHLHAVNFCSISSILVCCTLST